MTRPKAIDKVRKLLALARDPAATQAEAALARKRANDLIERFTLVATEYAPESPRRSHPVPPPPQPAAPVWFGSNTNTAAWGFANATYASALGNTFRIYFG